MLLRMTPGPTIIVRCPCCSSLLRLPTLASGNTFGARLWSDGFLEAPMWRPEPSVLKCARCRSPFLRRDLPEVGRLPFPFGGDDPGDLRVTLHSFPAQRRLEVMQVLRSGLGISLTDVKRMTEKLPSLLAHAVTFAAAERLERDLRDLGAELRVGGPGEPPSSPGSSLNEWKHAPLPLDADERDLLQLLSSTRLTSEAERELRLLAWQAGNRPFREDGVAWMPLSSRPAARENVEKLLPLLAATSDDFLVRAEVLRQLGRFDESRRVLDEPALRSQPAAKVIRGWVDARVERLSVLPTS